jgi:hypothetical protein
VRKYINIDLSIRNLVQRIDKGEEPLDLLLTRLIARLQKRCAHPKVVARYAQYGRQSVTTAKPAAAPRLPLDQDGYVIGFDPLTQEKEFVDSWNRYGIVVGANVVSQSQCQEVVARMHELLLALSDGTCNLSKPSTWNNIPVDRRCPDHLSWIFRNYHDQASPPSARRARLPALCSDHPGDLWTTLDRLGIKLQVLPMAKPCPCTWPKSQCAPDSARCRVFWR